MKKNKILEELVLPKGMEIDILEGWKKLTSRQFGGDPGRGFAELIQNLIDSYPATIAMEDRTGEINTTHSTISITDYGEGFSLEKIRLIVTLGGTDKSADKSKIGQFGIGFFSIFNRALGTREVTVTTRCEGFTVRIVFSITSADKLPKISMDVTEEKINFSTQIVVKFLYPDSVSKCLRYAKKSLNNYPCKIKIDGKLHESIWALAQKNNWVVFNSNHCNGLIKPSGYGNWVNVLCKYEHIINLSLNGLLCGAKHPAYNLEDYKLKSFPYIPKLEVFVNCDLLSLTISRDSFYLNYMYENMVNDLRNEFFGLLGTEGLKDNKDLVLANLYIFSYDVGVFLKNQKCPSSWSAEKRAVIKNLAEANVFQLSGKRKLYSLKNLRSMLTKGYPMFYSPNKLNVRWLGGAFKHDYVLLPERCQMENGANNFYKSIFSQVFDEIVDLDTIQGNNRLIQKLVEKGIVPKKALSPKIAFVGERRIKPEENNLLEEINLILKNENVIKAIEQNLYLKINSVQAMFFEIKKEGAYISTGIFDSDRKPITDDFISNLEKREESNEVSLYKKHDVLLGLRKDHPLIHQLTQSENPQKAYFALTYIAHELAFCQRLLVPHSSFFHFAKEKLAADLRKALIEHLFNQVA